eukprot:117181-Alexandrium_andersonii.AAC.1
MVGLAHASNLQSHARRTNYSLRNLEPLRYPTTWPPERCPRAHMPYATDLAQEVQIEGHAKGVREAGDGWEALGHEGFVR